MRAFARIAVLALSICCVAVVARAQGQNEVDRPIKIGAFLAVTGDGAYVGAPQLATLQLYIDLINKQGGVIGRPLELTYYDVGIDTRSAQTAVARLVDVDRVDLIIGGSTTGAAMSVLPLIARAEIPFMALASSSALVEPVNRWVFKTSPTDRLACGKIMDHLRRDGRMRMAILAGDGGFAGSMKEQCLAAAAKAGIAVVTQQTYPSQSRRVEEPLERLKQIGGFDAILTLDFGAAPPYVAQFFDRLRFGIPLYMSHVQVDTEFLELAGAAAETVRAPAHLLALAPDLAETNPSRRILLAYREAYRARWGVAPNVYGSFAHDALLIAIGAIARAGSADRTAVRDTIERTAGFVGANGIYTMSARDHMGLNADSFRMAEVRSGSWVLIE